MWWSTSLLCCCYRFHRCAWSRLCSILWRLCSLSLVCLFWAVYAGTRPGVRRPSGRGRGGGDAGSLLPGVLPPNQLHSTHAPGQTRRVVKLSVPPTPPTPPPRRFHPSVASFLRSLCVKPNAGDSGCRTRRADVCQTSQGKEVQVLVPP